jgi:hypothetical protein
MSYQWNTTQSIGEETKVAPDLTDFLAWDSHIQNLSGDELSQLFVEPQPDFTATSGMDFTSSGWNGLSNPFNQSYIQVSQLQPTNRDQNLSLEGLKQVVSELRLRQDKYEENIDNQLMQLKKTAVEQEKRVDFRIKEVKQTFEDLEDKVRSPKQVSLFCNFSSAANSPILGLFCQSS